MAETTVRRSARINGKKFALSSREVLRRVRQLEPEPIVSHFVVVAGRRYPPKQVISAVTGLDRADFTTHQARRTLMRLGFTPGRRGQRSAGPARPRSATAAEGSEPLIDRLGDLRGQWVAIRDDDVLYDAGTPQQLVAWLAEHGQQADSMFRVPEDELAAAGLAPQ